ncbi:Gfo/Idh/MocA family protein [Novipirellula artificiosorum]|uniref:Putative oxidoreductase YvaA n=1 Tax=Novipirellula artificiosorum TaxID=2528016 RepID=A0A5C6DD69_9BACT|nr:Gfo/Idh/MocA family oxidoreductase [Novipirellula artificiosorum]TWU35183.1 putative oxidoreductase YvaA [Novipirellula artificiosorum]
MIRVGVVGLGMMGLTHLNVYRSLPNVSIAAICDADPDRLSGKVSAAGNVEGQAQASVASLSADVRRCSDLREVIGAEDIDLVDICLPTHLHLRFGKAVLEAGQHLMMEKPLARNAADAAELAAAAESAKGLSFVGHCLRFWPGWAWLKEAVDDRRYGSVCSATFRRVVDHPKGAFYDNGDLCGGALLDLHVHDTDFVQYLFGMPKAVTSFGYSKITNEADHVVTRYQFDSVPLVVAEGGWAMTDGFTFNMCYTINFENATADFDLSRDKPLAIYEQGKTPEYPEVESKMGYDYEIEYFLECIEQQRQPTIVTMQDALNTIRIVDAEAESVKTGKTVTIEA